MKYLFAYSLLFITFASNAVTIEFVGPCVEKPFLIHKSSSRDARTVGELTIGILEKNRIPFQGTEKGLNQILSSPIGLDAMEVLSNNEMLSYGWCFEIDGIVPEVYPDEIPLGKSIHHITWFYGYAHYRNGEWIAQCQKSHLRKSPFICK